MNETQRQWFATDGVRTMAELGFASGHRVVDFGCGPGQFTVPTSRVVGPGGRVIAMDQSADALAQLAERLDAFGEPDAVDLVTVVGDGLAELAGDPVDAVLAFDVLQHVEDWAAFFPGVAARLAPGGRFYVYPGAGPHPDAVDMAAASAQLERLGFAPASTRRLHLPHAESMFEDTIHIFIRRGD